MVLMVSVLIDSVDVSSYLVSFELEHTFGDAISAGELKLTVNSSSVLTLANGMTVDIWRGWSSATEEKIFSGYVEQFDPDGGIVKVFVKDKLWDLVRREMTHSYDSNIDASAGIISEIFKDIVSTYGGLPVNNASVQNSGDAIVLSKFVCNHVDPFERCKKLADTLDWQFYYRASSDLVYFEPKAYTINSTVLTVGGNVLNIPRWQYDTTEMINDAIFAGAFQEIETTISGQIGVTSGFTADGIDLSYEPISVKVYGDASNPPTTLKIGGVVDSTVSFDYYVDKVQKKVLPNPDTHFTTNHYYEVRYSFAQPIPIHLTNQNSIDTYGLFKKTITLRDVRNVADAEQRGLNYLSRYSTPFVYATLKVKSDASFGLGVGQKIRVVDNISKPLVDSLLVINKHRIRYPGDYDEIDVGDKFWRLAEWQGMVMEKLKRLEEDELSNQDVITELVSNDTSTSTPITFKTRYVSMSTQGISAPHSFILGNVNHGRLGTDELGYGGVASEVVVQIIPGQGVFEEFFFDTEFVDTANTNATVDTANLRVIS